MKFLLEIRANLDTRVGNVEIGRLKTSELS